MHEGAATASASEGQWTGHARGRGAQDRACTRARGTGQFMHEDTASASEGRTTAANEGRHHWRCAHRRTEWRNRLTATELTAR
ncbi:hypothetical protein NDU88_006696 [Pleurodeles waltl]|uniref:Uncharacterized protein n=1 Tax=Pleurodeles waltl TaxID=8319 RepID=A0AAV7MN28_PLEWA|nr:hypothetical protein NDU88_006696 [Pleurodeles waltl]